MAQIMNKICAFIELEQQTHIVELHELISSIIRISHFTMSDNYDAINRL